MGPSSCGIRAILFASLILGVACFVQPLYPSATTASWRQPRASMFQQHQPSTHLEATVPSTDSVSLLLAADTVDPTSFLSGILGGLIGTDAILLVPIVAAISVAAVIFGFIISYANPQVEDDE